MQDVVFPREEYEIRLKNVHTRMEREGIDLLILSAPDSIYYLTGYHTRAIAAHQYVAIPSDRAPLLMTRRLDLGNFLAVADSSPIEDCACYDDDTDNPLEVFVNLLDKNKVQKGCVGIEKENLYMTIKHYEVLRDALNQPEFRDCSNLLGELRLSKSFGELECHRRAAAIVVKAMRLAIKAICPGTLDSSVAAEAASALIKEGSEWIVTWPIVLTGRQTGRLHSSWQNLAILEGEPTIVEIAGAVKRYHTPLYRTVIFNPSDEHRRMSKAVREAHQTGLDTIRSAVLAGQVYDAVQSVIAVHGYSDLLLGRCGYSVGIGFPPNWVQRVGLDIVRNSKRVLRSGMVFHMVTLLLVPNKFSIGESSTIVVTKTGCENLTDEMERGPILAE